MSDDNAPITVTLKGGKDYDAPWISLRGDTPEQVTLMLNNLGGLPEAVAAQANLFTGTVNAGPILQQPAQQAPPQQQGWPQQGWQGNQSQPQTGQHGAQLHPEGLACGCGKTLEYGKTRTNKGQWKCPDYRWNNGNPNDHRLEWAQ